MSRKHFALLITMLSLSLVHQAFAGDEKRHLLQTSGILSGYCISPPNAPGAYISGLGDDGNGLVANVGCNTAPMPPASLPYTPIPMPSDGALTHLVATAIGVGPNVVVTLIVNGSPTALTCAFAGSSNDVARDSCSDEQHSVRLHTGDLVAVYVSVDSSFAFYDLTVALDRMSPVRSDKHQDEP